MSNGKVDTRTGEVTHTERLPIVAGPEPLPVAKMQEYLVMLEDYKNKILKEGVDYQVIPGTKKPSLVKPGAEKLAFGFNLSSSNETVSETEDHFREWEYDKPIYEWRGKKKEIVGYTRETTRGFYAYKVRCTMSQKATGLPWADSIGECSSIERGRETAPANTILKMAAKRAYVGAVLNATFSSDRWTQDMEDQQKGASAGPQAAISASKPSDSSGDSQAPRQMKSNFGTEDKPNRCTFCGKYHVIEGDIIVLSSDTGKWGSLTCYEDKVAEVDSASGKTKSDASEPPAGRLAVIMNQNKNDIQAQALELLNKLAGEDQDRSDEIFRQAVQDEVISEGSLTNNTKEKLANFVIYLQDRIAAEAM